MQSTSLRAHDVIGQLVPLAITAVAPVRVIDGPGIKPSEFELLLIGWQPNIQQPIRATRGEDDLCGRMTESGEIDCYIAVRTGSNDMAAVRGRASEILELFEAAVRADDTRMGGTADEVSIGPDLSIAPYQDANEGASVGLSFTVRYLAFI